MKITIEITPAELKEMGYVSVQDVMDSVYTKVVKENPLVKANEAIRDKVFKQRKEED